YLSLLNVSYSQWSRGDDVLLSDIVNDCDHVLLLISDSVIDSFIREHDCLQNKSCLHFSGSLVTELALGVHPLMTFGPELYTLAEYQEIPWVIEESSCTFQSFFPMLSNPSFSISKDQKGYYHALCVLSNNFTTLLWKKCFDEMAQVFKIPKEYLLPIFNRTMRNIADDHELALTGPLVRGDEVTVANNLNALSNDAYQKIYQAFVQAYKEENG
ncbi:MAG: DUF2520 domain-containing protein, partial [Coxiellaceae bacterium]|nr:DUF2520 domain-containing protein [Coxiellaceae bacterium]